LAIDLVEVDPSLAKVNPTELAQNDDVDLDPKLDDLTELEPLDEALSKSKASALAAGSE
jgi:hypothetical protein